jgi:predicted Zn-dependent peptidase
VLEELFFGIGVIYRPGHRLTGSAVSEIAFGPAHPLGASSANPEALRDITAADFQQFRGRFWHPDASVLVFAGDITIEQATAVAARYLGEWTGSAEPPGKLPPPAPIKGRTFLVERKGVNQTRVVMILPGINQTNPDDPALMLADTAFGGGAFSRLFRGIRLDRGIAYEASSNLGPLPEYGLGRQQSRAGGQNPRGHGCIRAGIARVGGREADYSGGTRSGEAARNPLVAGAV